MFLHMHTKEKRVVQSAVTRGRIYILIPIQLDAGYPLFFKGSHIPGTHDTDVDPAELPLDIGGVLMWHGETSWVYPAVSGFERGGGFAILLGY